MKVDSLKNNDNSININDLAGDFPGNVSELTEPQRAKIRMTYSVLFGATVLLIGSGATYILCDNYIYEFAHEISDLCRLSSEASSVKSFCEKHPIEELFANNYNSAAKDFFEFCKNFIPPIITLVLGAHYVTRSSDASA